MTRQSSIARAALLEKAGPAMISRFHVEGEPVDFPVTEEDLDRDEEFWKRALSAYGVGTTSRVVVSATSYEAAWFQPPRTAAASLGGSYSNVEVWGWDAPRLDMFCRRLQPVAVIGAGRELLDGLANTVDLAQRLGPIPALLVRPDALGVLADAGIRHSGVVTAIGPATAVSLADGSGMAYDTDQWVVESENGELLVSSRGNRAATFSGQRTGVRGSVEQTPAGPRIVLER